MNMDAEYDALDLSSFGFGAEMPAAASGTTDTEVKMEMKAEAETEVETEPAPIDDDRLSAAIRTILQGADLEQLSRRMIRKQLEAEFRTNLSLEKDRINAWILRIIEEQQQEQEQEQEQDGDGESENASDNEDEENSGSEDDADDDNHAQVSVAAKARPRAPRTTTPKKKPAAPRKKAAVKRKRSETSSGDAPKRANAFNIPLSVSPELASVVGADTMSRPQIVKTLWEYIREHDLQDPSNKRLIRLDDTLRGVFQRETVTMFSMNKYVKRHVRKPEELPPGGWNEIHRDGVSSDEDEEEKAAKKKATATKRKKKPAADGATNKENRKNNPFNAELSLSPELAAVVGSAVLPRPQIVKLIWEYIRAHNLQDPSDKRTIILDDTLRRVFGRDTVTMFSINKYIKRHAMKPENLPAGGWADVARDGASSDEDDAKAPAKKKKAKH